ncbi:MAG: adenosylcobinamide-GDP ribazoletransferase [Desulfamplus sp.]|nr:adenosylcobinamide-GDP ribazoletransferase [Desulfamplus sp.]
MNDLYAKVVSFLKSSIYLCLKLSDFRSAIAFITTIPAGRDVPFSPLGMIRFFPVVGLILGAIVASFDIIASLFWSVPVVAMLDVVLLVILTGAFHLDGLGDSADGIFSHRSKERALEIMKDSRTGMMGLIAIFLSLCIKIAGIYGVKSLNSQTGEVAASFLNLFDLETILIFLIVPSYSRASMLFGIRYFKYGRDMGTGHGLFAKKLPLKDFIFVLLPIFLSLLIGFRGIIISFAFAMFVALILLFYKKKMGCITGDMLGAMCEITESMLFLMASANI